MRPALLFLPLIAVLLFFSSPAAYRQGAGVLSHLQSSAEQRFALRARPFAPLIREVERRVPPDEAILIHTPKGASAIHWDLVINYWLYPRKIYSVRLLQLTGEDVRQFVRARQIPWVYRGGKLERLGAPVPLPDGVGPLPSPRKSGALRAAVGVLLAIVHFLAVGACILGGVECGRRASSRTERLALSFLLGSGAVGVWVVLCFVTGFGVRISTVLLSLPLSLAFFAFRRYRVGPATRAPRAPSSHRMGRVAAWIVLVLLGFLVLRAAAMPMGGYDDRYQWAHKAHLMLHEPSIWSAGFQGPQSLHGHPRYPLLIPGIEAAVFLYAGDFDDQYVTLLFPLFLGALLTVLHQGLPALGRGRGRGLAILALLLVPAYWGYGISRDGAAAFAAYPDLPLSVFITAAMVYLLRARAQHSAHLYLIAGLLLLFCGLTKSEGKVHCLVFIALALAPLVVGSAPRSGLRSALAAFGGAGLLILLYELAVVQPSQAGAIPDDYGQLLNLDRVTANLGRLGSIVPMLSKEYFLSVRFGFPGLLLAAAALLFLRRRSGSPALLPLAYVLALAVLFCGPYLLLPEDEWTKTYAWSAGRLVLQLVPMAFLALSILVLPRCEPSLAARADPTERA